MNITGISTDLNNNIIISVDVAMSQKPYLMRRISPDLWRYHDKRVALKTIDEDKIILDNDTLFSLFDLKSPFSICDVLCCDDALVEHALNFATPKKFKGFCCKFVFVKNYGIIRVELYINGSNSLSARIYAEENCTFKVFKLSEDDDYVNFRIDNDIQECHYELFLACRERSKHDFHYRNFIKIRLTSTKSKNSMYFRIKNLDSSQIIIS